MAELEREVIREAVRDGTSAGMAGLPKLLSDSIDTALKNFSTMLGTDLAPLKKLPDVLAGIQGSGNVNTALDTTMATIARHTGLAGTALGAILDVLQGIRSDARTMGNIGIGQQDAIGTRLRAQEAGYANVTDAINHLGSLDKSIKGGGKSMDEAAKNFTDFAKEIQRNPQIENLLRRGIIRPEDIPKIAALAAGGKTTQLSDPEQRRKLAQDTAALATSIEKQVNAYGLNREAVLKNSQDLNNSAEEQLKMQALRSDAERQSVRDMQTNAAAQGESIQKIISSLAAGQRLDRSQAIMLQMATGGRGGQFRSAVREMRRTSNLEADDPLRIAARERFQRELANMNAAQNRQRFAQIGLNTTDPDIRNAALELQRQNQAKASQGATQQQLGLTPAQAQALQMEIAKQGMLGNKQEKITEGRPGVDYRNAEAETLTLISTAYLQARANAVAATSAFADLNKELGKAPERLQPVREFFNFFFGGPSIIPQDKMAAYKDMIKLIDDMLLKSQLPAGERGQNNPLRQGLNPTINSQNTTINTPSVTVNQANQPPQPPTGTNNPLRQEVRAGGTLGETGAPIEPRDVFAKLHKGETVLNPGQLSNLIGGVKSNALENVNTTLSSMSTVVGKKQEVSVKPIKVDFGSVLPQQPRQSKVDPVADLGKMIGQLIGALEGSTSISKLQGNKQQPSIKVETPKIPEPVVKPNIKVDAPKIPEPVVKPNIKVDAPKIPEFVTPKSRINEEESILFPKINDAFTDFKAEKSQPVEPPKELPTPVVPPILEEKVGIKDLHDELIQLNTHIKQLIDHSADISELSSRQIRATEKSSSNRFA